MRVTANEQIKQLVALLLVTLLVRLVMAHPGVTSSIELVGIDSTNCLPVSRVGTWSNVN
jgi:hypothetical protein